MRGRQNDKPAQSKPQDKPLRSFVFKHNLGAYQNWIFIGFYLLAEDKVSCSHEEYLQIGLDGFDWWSVSMCICVSALSICVTFPWTAVWGEDTYLSTDSPRSTFHTWPHPLITKPLGAPDTICICICGRLCCCFMAPFQLSAVPHCGSHVLYNYRG